MTSSIYISSEKIIAIGYNKRGRKIKIKDYLSYDLPEGSMINGKILDSAHISECLVSMRKNTPALFKSPTLIVDGNSILSKRLPAPKLNKWQCLQLIQNEFADTVQNADELVCDYQMLAKTTSAPAAMFVCAADRSHVEEYVDAFKNAGINLEAIHIGAQAVQNYVSAKYELQRKTFVLNIIDGLTLFSMIFDNNVNVFTSRTRLYSEDKDSFVQSLIENLSGLIQFNRSQKFNDIEASYYLGLTPDNLSALQSSSPYPDIQMEPLDIFSGAKKADKLSDDAHLAYLNALLGPESIDLMLACKKLDQLKKRLKPKPWVVPALLCVLLALAVPVAYLFAQIYRLDKESAELNEYLTSPAIAEQSAELNAILSETSRYSYISDQLDAKIKTDNGKASISNQILDLVTGTHKSTVTISRFGFDEATGILSIDGSSASENDSARYVDALKVSGLIQSAKYTGYSYNNNGEYNFSVDLTLYPAEVAE